MVWTRCRLRQFLLFKEVAGIIAPVKQKRARLDIRSQRVLLTSATATLHTHWSVSILFTDTWWAHKPWWRHQMETFSALLALCAGNSPVPVNSPHKGQWRGALMFSLICAWIHDWVNNREAGDLRRRRGHYDVIVMVKSRENWFCSYFSSIVLVTIFFYIARVKRV